MAADIDVGTAGYAIDITAAEFKFSGQSISAAITEMEWNTKTEEELVHFQGLQDPQERTKGQRSHDGTCSWGARQWALFCQTFGGRNAVLNREFNLVVNCKPENDNKLYTYTFNKFRTHSDSGNLNKSAGMTKVTFSFLSFDLDVTVI